MEDLSDEALMLKYGEGDTKAFEILYRRHKDSLYRFVRRQCLDRDITRDLVHDIWLKLIKSRRQYRPQAPFKTYLFTVARHRLIDYYRAQAARIPAMFREGETMDVQELPDDARGGPEMLAQLRELLDRSLERIHSLPHVQRETVLMYVEGLSLGEIAVITHVPTETARSRVRTALAKLRKELGELVS